MKKVFIRLATAIATLGLTSCVYEEIDYGFTVKTGETAPDFTIELTDGSTLDLNSLSGKTILLQFLSTTCPVCREESPAIENEIWQEHKDNEDFYLLGIDLMEEKEAVTKYIDELHLTYPIGLDRDGKIFRLYAKENSGVTRNILIGKNGKILMLTRLFEREEFEKLKQAIEEDLK